MEYKLPPLPEPHTSDTEEVGTSHGGEPEYADVSLFSSDQLQAYAIAAIEAQGVPDGYALVSKGALQMVVNVLQRDAANGMRVRGEIVEQLLASAPPAPQAEELVQWKARALQAEAVVAKFMEPQASGVQQEPVAFLYQLEYGASVVNRKVSEWRLNYPFGVCGADYLRINDEGVSYVREIPLYTHPAQQAKPQPLSDEQIEKGRQATFSTNNPFCPCDSKTMRKAVRWAESAHGIQGS